MKEEVLRILREAREKILDPQHWTVKEFARDKRHEVVVANSPEACSWCALGSLLSVVNSSSVVDVMNGKRTAARSAKAALSTAAYYITDGEKPVTQVNDILGHAEVIRLYDKAIELVSQDKVTV